MCMVILHDSSRLLNIFYMTKDGAKQQIMVMIILYPKGYHASQFVEAIIETFSYIILR